MKHRALSLLFLAIILLVIIALPVMALDREYISSGVKTTSTLIYTGKTLFSGVIVTTDGTNNGTIACYDNTTNSGTKLFPDIVVLGSNRIGGLTLENPLKVNTGIYCTISGTGASFVVYRAIY